MSEVQLTSLSKDELHEFMKDNLPEGFAPPKAEPPRGKKICLAILSYDGRMECKNALSLMQAMAACGERGWGFTYILREADSMVARGRSFLASQFLENPQAKDCTDFVQIDVDLSFSADDFIKLCEAPVDVIGGAYPFKDESGDFPLRWPSDGLYEENGLWVVQAVTPGFFRCTRKALETVARDMPWLEFRDRGVQKDERTWMFFDNLHRPSGIYDEGYIFCERWRGSGGKVYLNPDFNITHIGKKAYNHGTLRQWLARKGETFEKLESEYPGVPPLLLMNKAMGAKIDLEAEKAKLIQMERLNSGDDVFGPVVSGVAA